jgi:uncharacterized protein YjbI with pentapeptide repeats
MLFRLILLSLCSFLMYVGCIEIQPSNPYDPNAPLSVQFKGTIKGVFQIQGEDLSPTTSYKLQLLTTQNRPIVDDQDEIVVYQTRTQTDLDEFQFNDDDVVVGSFEIQVQAGTYSLLFDPELNGTPQLSRELSPSVKILPGQVYELNIVVQKTQSFDEYDCLVDIECQLGQVCKEGVCVTDLEADRDRDGLPDLEDNCPDFAGSNQEDTDADGKGNLCDDDNDNDGHPNRIDNCEFHFNPIQGDANENDIGNACDEEVSGISIRGILDFSAVPGANHTLARVYLSGQSPIMIEADGSFVFEQAIEEPKLVLLQVQWPGFEQRVIDLEIPDRVEELVLDPIILLPSTSESNILNIQGQVFLEGSDSHEDIVVRARVGGSLVATTLTDELGQFVLTLPPIDLTLQFSKEGFEELEIDLLYQSQGPNEGELTLDDMALDEVEDLELERVTGEVSVEVIVLPEWIPVGQRQATVSVIGEGEERSAVVQGASVVFTDLPSGDYLVFAERPGFTEARQTFRIDKDVPNASVVLTMIMQSLSDARLEVSGLSLSGEDLANVADLRGADLSGADLNGANLCNLDLSGVSFIGSNLQGANLSGSRLVGTRLDNSSMEGAHLHGADLTNASLFGANLSSALLYKSSFECRGRSFESERTNLTGATLSSALMESTRFVAENEDVSGVSCTSPLENAPILNNTYWNQTNLNEADLRGVHLQDATLSSTILTNVHLDQACLRGANLIRVDLSEASLTGSDLSLVSMLDALLVNVTGLDINLTESSLSGVNLTNAALTGIQGDGMSFSGVIFQNTALNEGTLIGSNWVGSLLNQVDLGGSNLSNADLRNVQVVDSILLRATMVNVDLRNSVLTQSELMEIDFTSSDLVGANLGRANVEGTNFTGCDLLEANFRLARYSGSTSWPNLFDKTTIEALGPNTQLEHFLFPNGFVAHGVQLQGANLYKARLIEVDFSNGNLEGVNLSETDLSGVNLSGVNLSEADLSKSNLSGADLSNTTLRLSSLYHLQNCPESLPNSDYVCFFEPYEPTGPSWFLLGPNLVVLNKLIDISLENLNLSGSDFSSAQLSNVSTNNILVCPTQLPNPERSDCIHNGDGRFMILSDGVVLGEQIDGVVQNSIDISGQDLRGLSIRNSSFVGGNFSGADLQGVDFSGTNLAEAVFSGADLQGVNFSGTNLAGSVFSEQDLAIVYNGETTCPDGSSAFEYVEYDHRRCNHLFDVLCLLAPNGCADLDFVRIEGGEFSMGSEDYSDEQPIHTVNIPDFEMMHKEVTVAQYRACVDADFCSIPRTGPDYNWGILGRDDHPMNGISWFQLNEFAEWVDARLPSESEWEYAARRGGDDVNFPWGNDAPSSDLAIYATSLTAPVCSKIEGNTSQGLCDMAGNVWEWVQDEYHRDYVGAPVDGIGWCTDDCSVNANENTARMMRGGGFRSAPALLRVTHRFNRPSSGQYAFGGGRLVRSINDDE